MWIKKHQEGASLKVTQQNREDKRVFFFKGWGLYLNFEAWIWKLLWILRPLATPSTWQFLWLGEVWKFLEFKGQHAMRQLASGFPDVGFLNTGHRAKSWAFLWQVEDKGALHIYSSPAVWLWKTHCLTAKHNLGSMHTKLGKASQHQNSGILKHQRSCISPHVMFITFSFHWKWFCNSLPRIF